METNNMTSWLIILTRKKKAPKDADHFAVTILARTHERAIALSKKKVISDLKSLYDISAREKDLHMVFSFEFDTLADHFRRLERASDLAIEKNRCKKRGCKLEPVYRVEY